MKGSAAQGQLKEQVAKVLLLISGLEGPEIMVLSLITELIL